MSHGEPSRTFSQGMDAGAEVPLLPWRRGEASSSPATSCCRREPPVLLHRAPASLASRSAWRRIAW